MKTPEEVTQQELDLMKKHHRMSEYTNQDAIEVVNLVRAYISPHAPTCLTCHSNLRDAKNSLNTFYLFHRDSIEKRLSGPVEEKLPEDKFEEQPGANTQSLPPVQDLTDKFEIATKDANEQGQAHIEVKEPVEKRRNFSTALDKLNEKKNKKK